MAYVSTDHPVGYEAAPRADLFSVLASAVAAIADPLRKRRAYRQTVRALQDYSERNLMDIGASQGVHEFARRAAGL